MPIIYLYISLLKRITEIFQRHIRTSFTDYEAYYLISFYEVFIFANIIFKTQYSGALLGTIIFSKNYIGRSQFQTIKYIKVKHF